MSSISESLKIAIQIKINFTTTTTTTSTINIATVQENVHVYIVPYNLKQVAPNNGCQTNKTKKQSQYFMIVSYLVRG